jgi:hypothetical protein
VFPFGIHPCGFVEMRGTQAMAKIFRSFKPFSGSIPTKNLAVQQCCGSDRIQIFYFWLLDFNFFYGSAYSKPVIFVLSRKIFLALVPVVICIFYYNAIIESDVKIGC